jgi:hypothetical protein
MGRRGVGGDTEEGNGEDRGLQGGVQDFDRMFDQRTADEAARDQAERTEKIIEWMLDKRLTYRVSLAVSNAYSAVVLGIFLMLLCMVVQAGTGTGLHHEAELRSNGTVVGEDVKQLWRTENNTVRHGCYLSSSRSDWIQSCIGMSGGWYGPKAMQVEGIFVTSYTTDLGAVPIAGSVFSGVVLGHLGVAALLSIYLSLAATPEGERSYSIFEPRGLIVVNGLVSICSTQAVERYFASCHGDGGWFTFLFLIFCTLACWADELPSAILGAVIGKRDETLWERRISCSFRLFILVLMCFVPLSAVAAANINSDIPGTVLVGLALPACVLSMCFDCLHWQLNEFDSVPWCAGLQRVPECG